MADTNKLKYALVGSNGYIAPRHIKAIEATGGILSAVIDLEFSEDFFTSDTNKISQFFSLEEFLKQDSTHCDYVVICSPNFLHEEHIELSLKAGKEVICEKPVALSLNGLERLEDIEEKSIGKVNTILQLRLHPVIKKLKQKFINRQSNQVKLIYVAKRDDSYFKTWKGSNVLSGGMITNVGIHYLDLMTFLFGEVIDIDLHINDFNKSSGTLYLENGNLEWLFSFHPEDIERYIPPNESSHRSFLIDHENIDFSKASEDLHITSYKEINKGKGFSLQDAKPSIAIIDSIINQT